MFVLKAGSLLEDDSILTRCPIIFMITHLEHAMVMSVHISRYLISYPKIFSKALRVESQVSQASDALPVPSFAVGIDLTQSIGR